MANLSAVSVLADEELIKKSKLLVVGAGGIGCEILKNLAMSGFEDIEIIDLDTIDVSNLNRQFLFRKEHVGKSKAMVARETIINHNPNVKIKAYHDSITTSQYGVNFFKRFTVVLNALDNRAARNHVNRMCLAADVPLIESGTSGYTGQVEIIKKGLTQCYECQPKPPQKTFPGCTIRNTPSEPVHCIVWAKHLFNQLFGEADPDQDVSPDTEDPEAAGGDTVENHDKGDGNVQRVLTRQWVEECEYNPCKLFTKFFSDDIKYLLKMDKLWESRTPPKPLTWDVAESSVDENGQENTREDMKVWSLSKCTKVFASTVKLLRDEMKKREFLVWDKDDKPALDFVTACANVRSHIFNIPRKSRFDVKSIAGNIIPAIATTNAIVAGLVVLKTFRLLKEDYENCKSNFVRQKSSDSKTVIMAETQLIKANPKCYVCAAAPLVNVYLNTTTLTVKEFENEILKKTLNMIAPDVMLDGQCVVIISSEEGETEINNDKLLSDVGIVDGCMLKAEDFLQNYELKLCIHQYTPKDKDDPLFKISTDEELKAKPEEQINGTTKTNGNEVKPMETEDDVTFVSANDDDPQEGPSKRMKPNPPEEDNDLVLLDD